MDNSGRKELDNTARSKREKAHKPEWSKTGWLVGLSPYCHSIHSALPDLPHTEIKGCGRSFTLSPESRLWDEQRSPHCLLHVSPSLGGPDRHWEFFAMATPSSAAALGRSSPWTGLTGACTAPWGPRKAQGKQLCWKITTSKNYKKQQILPRFMENFIQKTLEKKIRGHTLIISIFFNRSIWAILKWRYEIWIRKWNKETLSSEKWWSIPKM